MQFIKVRIAKGIAWVTLDRQSKLNALNAEVMNDLETCFLDLKDNTEVQVIVITGAGEKAFAAGADVNQFPTMSAEDAFAFAKRGQAVFSLIESSLKPVIAAINGFALGGGCELAMACHLRYASENAQFGQPEVKLGVIAGFGGTQRLPRLVGNGHALDLLLSGRIISAKDAADIGLVNQVFTQETLFEKVEETAIRIMTQGPQAVAYTIKAVYGGAEKSLIDGLAVEAEAFRDVFKTQDRVEGASAFLERRSPDFKNQ